MKFINTIVFTFFIQIVSAQLANVDSFKSANSPYDELQPVLSQDRKMLFFTIANHPQNIGGKKDPGDIWFSIFVGEQWTVPIHGGSKLNDKAYNAVAGVSSDGNQLFLLGHYHDGGTARTQGISVSQNNGNGWSRPENISIPYFQNKSNIFSGYVTPDKGVFVFSSETYGTRGVEDIYVSINEDGHWTEPRNLGNKINTQFQELSPALSSDGMTLYFSSNGRKGKGSFDVFSAVRLDETWKNWSEPTNLTEKVNTEGRELYYREYKDLGFSIFTSTKNSDGYGDIMIHRDEKPSPQVINQLDTLKNVLIQVPAIGTPNQVVKIYGKVTNTKTGELVNATLVFNGPSINDRILAKAPEGFKVTIPYADTTYTVNIEAQGYISIIEKLNIKAYEMKELEMNFKLQPVEVGTTVNLSNVLFERGTSTLLSESYPELDLVVSFLKTNPSIKIELSGHTDNRGVHLDNVKLSQERVDRVKQYLVSKGVETKRIVGKGYGGLKPIASNENEETRRLNRRVEFTIKKY